MDFCRKSRIGCMDVPDRLSRRLDQMACKQEIACHQLLAARIKPDGPGFGLRDKARRGLAKPCPPNGQPVAERDTAAPRTAPDATLSRHLTLHAKTARPGSPRIDCDTTRARRDCHPPCAAQADSIIVYVAVPQLDLPRTPAKNRAQAQP